MKKISSFFNGKTFAVISLAVCLTTAVFVFFRTANWDKYYAAYAESGEGSFPNNVGGLNFFAYFTEITVCVFTFFLTARAIYKLREKRGGSAVSHGIENAEICEKNDGVSAVSCGVKNAEIYEKNGGIDSPIPDKNPLDFTYGFNEKIRGKKDGKIRRSAISSKIKSLIENPNVNCALATYAIVGFAVVFFGELCGFMTRYADDLVMLNLGNIWMHFAVFPLFAVSAIFRETDKKAEVKRLPLYFVFPLAYFAFSMIRGALIEWYPYSFLNPAALYALLFPQKALNIGAGCMLVAAAAIIFAAFIGAAGILIIKLHNKKFDAKRRENI